MEELDIKMRCQELLGAYLKMKRRGNELTQEEVGINVGYSPHTAKQAISQIERGVTWVPDKKLNEFVRFLDLDASFFKMLSHYYSVKRFQDVQDMLNKLHAHEIRTLTDNSTIPIDPRPASKARIAQSTDTEQLEAHLRKLKDLHQKGLIDDDDYKEAKREALRKMMD